MNKSYYINWLIDCLKNKYKKNLFINYVLFLFYAGCFHLIYFYSNYK